MARPLPWREAVSELRFLELDDTPPPAEGVVFIRVDEGDLTIEMEIGQWIGDNNSFDTTTLKYSIHTEEYETEELNQYTNEEVTVVRDRKHTYLGVYFKHASDVVTFKLAFCDVWPMLTEMPSDVRVPRIVHPQERHDKNRTRQWVF